MKMVAYIGIMMSVIVAFGAGFALSASLIVAIGTQNLFVLRQGLKKEHVGPIVLFCALSDALLIAAGVSGMGVFLSVLPRASIILSVAGAMFLTGYGIQSFRRAFGQDSMVVSDEKSVSVAKALSSVAAFTWLNPHVYLDTVLLMGAAAMAQPASSRPAFAAGGALASLLWFLILGYGARLLRPVFARPRAWRILDCVIGCVMITLAGHLIRQGVFNHF